MSGNKLVGYLRERLQHYSQFVSDEEIREQMLDDADKERSWSLPRRRVARMLSEHYTPKQIAEELGCAFRSVYKLKHEIDGEKS